MQMELKDWREREADDQAIVQTYVFKRFSGGDAERRLWLCFLLGTLGGGCLYPSLEEGVSKQTEQGTTVRKPRAELRSGACAE